MRLSLSLNLRLDLSTPSNALQFGALTALLRVIGCRVQSHGHNVLVKYLDFGSVIVMRIIFMQFILCHFCNCHVLVDKRMLGGWQWLFLLVTDVSDGTHCTL